MLVKLYIKFIENVGFDEKVIEKVILRQVKGSLKKFNYWLDKVYFQDRLNVMVKLYGEIKENVRFIKVMEKVRLI